MKSVLTDSLSMFSFFLNSWPVAYQEEDIYHAANARSVKGR